MPLGRCSPGKAGPWSHPAVAAAAPGRHSRPPRRDTGPRAAGAPRAERSVTSRSGRRQGGHCDHVPSLTGDRGGSREGACPGQGLAGGGVPEADASRRAPGPSARGRLPQGRRSARCPCPAHHGRQIPRQLQTPSNGMSKATTAPGRSEATEGENAELQTPLQRTASPRHPKALAPLQRASQTFSNRKASPQRPVWEKCEAPARTGRLPAVSPTPAAGEGGRSGALPGRRHFRARPAPGAARLVGRPLPTRGCGALAACRPREAPCVRSARPTWKSGNVSRSSRFLRVEMKCFGYTESNKI